MVSHFHSMDVGILGVGTRSEEKLKREQRKGGEEKNNYCILTAKN